MSKRIEAPLSKELCESLRVGDRVLLSGTIYTARDAAHKLLVERLAAGEALPFPIEGAVIFYVGPTPPKPGAVIGSAGPTTAYRMDAYAPALLDAGQLGMIGKGGRSPEVIAAMQRNQAVYFAAVGGAGALLANQIKEAEVIAYEELGAEAVRRLTVVDMPLMVAVDAHGQDAYQMGPAAWRESQEKKGRG